MKEKYRQGDKLFCPQCKQSNGLLSEYCWACYFDFEPEQTKEVPASSYGESTLAGSYLESEAHKEQELINNHLEQTRFKDLMMTTVIIIVCVVMFGYCGGFAETYVVNVTISVFSFPFSSEEVLFCSS